MKVKQIIALVVVVALLMAGSVLVTFAYLTSKAEVTNTFTVGKVEITLDEAKVDAYGIPVEDADRVAENEYKLIPGHTYTKDPTVHISGDSEPSYIRAIVTVTAYEALCAAYGVEDGEELALTELTGTLGEGWEIRAGYTGGVYELRYIGSEDGIVEANEQIPAMFEEITIAGNITNEQLNALNEMKINVVAHAIQADGLGTADQAWAAFNP